MAGHSAAHVTASRSFACSVTPQPTRRPQLRSNTKLSSVRTLIQVISLPEAVERRARFASYAPSNGVAWGFFDGGPMSADGIEYKAKDALVSHGRELRRGEVGCFVSHYRAWRHFLETDYQQLLVLEDDVFVDWPGVLPLIEIDFAGCIDYLRLCATRPTMGREIGWLLGRRVLQYLHYCYGAQAYLLTRAGAEKFVAAAKVISRPVDDFLDRSWHHKVPNLGVAPFPVLGLSGESTIGAQADRHRASALSVGVRTQRFFYRASDKVRRLSHTARELSPAARIRRKHLPLLKRSAW